MSGLRGAVGAAPSLRRPTGSGRASQLLRCAVVASLVLFGLDVACMVLLEPNPGLITIVFVNAAIQAATAADCFWTARRARDGDRRWRRLIGSMAGGTMVASLATAATVLGGGSVQVSSGWYAVLFVFHGLALAGLLSLPTDSVDSRGGDALRQERGAHRWHAITILDCVLIVGSITLLEWGTALATVVRSGAPDLGKFLLTLVHVVAVLILVAAVVLIASFRRPRSPTTLALLGTGLLTYGLASNVFAYRVAQHRLDLPPWSVVAFGFAFLLIFLAALVPVPARARPDGPAPPGPRALWAHAVLPYVVLGAAGLMVLGKLSTGARLDRFETYGLTGLLLLALARQMLTLAENTRLLAEIRERERQLHHQAFHDPLTGLANRALFTRRLQRALAHDTDDAGAGTSLSVLFLDLDEFKRVNDKFGHATGDELLQISAERLRAGTRAVDTVARLGGDEFAIILDGSSPDNPRSVGERLAAAIQAPCLLAGQPYTPRASLGLVTLDSVARPASPDMLLHQADLAMYAAKRERAGRLVVYRPDLPPPAITARRDTAVTRPSSEPDGAPFTICYRPVVDLCDGQTAAVHTDLRAELTTTPNPSLLERVCRDLAAHRLRTGADDLAVLVAVAPDRAGEDSLVADVVDALHQHNIPTTSMILSLTGTDQIPDLAAAAHVFTSLADRGIRLAVEDLADGEQLLAVLRLLPARIALLHPDLSNADDVPGAHARRAALRATIRIAAQLGIPAVATAADDHQRVCRLIEEGCPFTEGRFYGIPGPLADLTLFRVTGGL